MQNRWAEIKIRAARRAGKLLDEMSLKPGNHPWLQAETIVPPRLADLGIKNTQAHRWHTLDAPAVLDWERGLFLYRLRERRIYACVAYG